MTNHTLMFPVLPSSESDGPISGMSLATIRQDIDPARQGPGNEHERLELLRRHVGRVETQIRELQETLDVMRYKVRIYEEHVARGEAERLWNPSHPDTARAGTGQECHPQEGA
ncbi:MerR family DNA-binding protein [Streptomyces zaomyceticus]|uniref:MerR family DNA-binding protein n=2 Tax=Streptomyces zaomyceticus TaxID=68286 RepID=UPI002E1A118F